MAEQTNNIIIPLKPVIAKFPDATKVVLEDGCIAKIKYENKVRKIPFYFLETIPAHALLGLPFCTAFDINISFFNDMCSVTSLCMIDQEEMIEYKPRIDEKIALEPKSITYIKCTSNLQHGQAILKRKSNEFMNECVYTPNCIVSVKYASCFIPFLNITSRSINTIKQMCIGTLEIINNTSINTIMHDQYDLNRTTNIDTTQENINYNFDIGEDLDPQQKIEIRNFLKENISSFAFTEKEITRTDKAVHRIDTGLAEPIYCPPYRCGMKEKAIIEQKIQEQLEAGHIVKSTSPWAAPCVLVPKKDGTMRFCVDFRKLNSVTRPSRWPLARIDTILDSLESTDLYTSLDARSGFYTIPVNEADQEKTSFVCHLGQYMYKYMPFGLCDSVQSYSRLLDLVLTDLKYNILVAYLDDILVYSKGFPQHMERLKIVFQRLKDAKISLHPKKCSFAKCSLKFLGHIVSKAGIALDKDKVSDILDIREPTCVKEIRSFLGCSGYYRRFIKDFSIIAKPLTTLTKKDKPFIWDEDCQRAFDTLKEKLTTAPVLAHFDERRETRLHTDGSYVGIGAVLVQIVDGQEHPVAYLSRQLTKSEKNYAVTELECLAVVYAVTKFRPYLLGIHFTVVSDHSSLVWLMNMKDPSGRCCRWSLRMAEYNFTVVHRPGRVNSDADALSRLPVWKHEPFNECDDYPLLMIEDDQMKKFQEEDQYCQKIKKKLELKYRIRFIIEDGLLYKRTRDRNILVLPKILRREILYSLHNAVTAGHPGKSKLYFTLRRRYYWPRMFTSVSKYVDGCLDCGTRKRLPHPVKGRLKSIEAKEPFIHVCLDHIGPFPITEKGYKYILNGVDLATRFAVSRSVKSTDAETTAKFFTERICLIYGFPRYLTTDNGTGFTALVIQEVLKSVQVKHIRTTAYHPQSNGLCERVNGILVEKISHYINTSQKNWAEVLPWATFAYNSNPQSSTGLTPCELAQGFLAALPSDRVCGIKTESTYCNSIPENYNEMRAIAEEINEKRAIARERLCAAQENQADLYDEHTNPIEFVPGDLVFVY